MAKTSTVRVSEHLLKQLRAEAKRDGRTLTWLLNEAIKTYLGKYNNHAGGQS